MNEIRKYRDMETSTSNTMKKLNEARFFLKKMKEEFSKKSPTFDYYLSAFLEAARSITWIMKKEYSGNHKWEQWYNTRTPNESEKLILDRINSLRVDTVHIEPIETDLRINSEIDISDLQPEIIQLLTNLPGRTFDAEVGPPNEDGIQAFRVNIDGNLIEGTITKVFRQTGTIPEEDIMELCSSYFRIMEGLVKDCQSIFI
jgi:hypothetical protein